MVYSWLRKIRTLVFPRFFCKYVSQKDNASYQTEKLRWIFSELFKKNRGSNFLQPTVNWPKRDICQELLWGNFGISWVAPLIVGVFKLILVVWKCQLWVAPLKIYQKYLIIILDIYQEKCKEWSIKVGYDPRIDGNSILSIARSWEHYLFITFFNTLYWLLWRRDLNLKNVLQFQLISAHDQIQSRWIRKHLKTLLLATTIYK